MTMCFVTAAFDLCALGFKVLPLIPGRKVPLLKDSLGTASDDEDQISTWGNQHPAANIGVVTGPRSNLTVVDIDVKGNVDGRKALRDLAARGKVLPKCPISRTPTGGFHLWFRSSPGLTNVAGVTKAGRGLGVGIDVRANGGYIVAPPSRLVATEDHPAGAYRWTEPPTSEADFPALPLWAADMIRVKEQPIQPFVMRKTGENSDRHLERIAAFMASVGAGQRNQALYWATREALREGARPQDVISRLTDAAKAAGLHAHEIHQTINSGISAERTTT